MHHCTSTTALLRKIKVESPKKCLAGSKQDISMWPLVLQRCIVSHLKVLIKNQSSALVNMFFNVLWFSLWNMKKFIEKWPLYIWHIHKSLSSLHLWSAKPQYVCANPLLNFYHFYYNATAAVQVLHKNFSIVFWQKIMTPYGTCTNRKVRCSSCFILFSILLA